MRARIVLEARSWVGTPYHTGGRAKGAGCDCGTCLYCVLLNSGAVDPDPDLEEFFSHVSCDAWAHWTDEQYLFRMRKHAVELMSRIAVSNAGLEPGNLVLVQGFGAKFYNHGGIVTAWPKIVHCMIPRVAETSALWHPVWSHQKIAVFDPVARRFADVGR